MKKRSCPVVKFHKLDSQTLAEVQANHCSEDSDSNWDSDSDCDNDKPEDSISSNKDDSESILPLTIHVPSALQAKSMLTHNSKIEVDVLVDIHSQGLLDMLSMDDTYSEEEERLPAAEKTTQTATVKVRDMDWSKI